MNILFVHQNILSVSWVQRDFDILASAHNVRDFPFTGIGCIPSLWRATRECDVAFSWFGKLHAFFVVLFSKMQGKKAVVVAGGDDVAHEPGYGMFAYWWKRWCPLFVFRHADLILCVSECARREAIKNAKADPAKCVLLYHGFELDRYRRVPGIAKENIALTVGSVNAETVTKKGIALFVESAAYLPDVPFFLVGPCPDGAINGLRSIASKNVRFLGAVYGDELVKLYNRAGVYAQPSQHESFGCSVAEAMLCECVPVLSRKGALPEVGGDTAFYIDSPTPSEVAARVREAMSHPEMGPKVRERIEAAFPLERRRQELLASLDRL